MDADYHSPHSKDKPKPKQGNLTIFSHPVSALK